MSRKLFLMVVVLALASLLAGCAGAAFAQATTPTVAPPTPVPPTGQVFRTMNVNGTGKVYLTPDIAYITIGVHTEGASANEAVSANNAQTEDVIAALTGTGISSNDIQTTNFSIYPQQVYDDQGRPTGEIKYSVDNSVYVTIRNIDQVGDVLDTVVSAGANNISGIQFDVQDKTSALSSARKAAVDDAQAKAQELAADAGLELGPIQTISEYTSGGPVPMYDMRSAAPMAQEAASVPVQPGQMLLTLEVNIVYEIR